MSRLRAPLALMALVLLAPLADAHIQGARPIMQPAEGERTVMLQPSGLDLRVDLPLTSDPLRQPIRYDVRPATDGFRVEHREDGSDASEAFFAQWHIERILEYRDNNLNGLWDNEPDTLVKAWRPLHYQWRVGGIQQVVVAEVRAESAVWEANLTGAPELRLEVVAAGRTFSDEGAFVRPQDLAVYLNVAKLPPRDVGSLYAVEIRMRTEDAASLSLHVAEETPTALLADVPRRRALFVWGGEAVLDGAERRLGATLREERVEEGARSALLVLHIPVAESDFRFVLVWGLEYRIEVRRGAPEPPAALALLAVGAVALAARRTRDREKR